MKRIFVAALALGFMTALSAAPASAQSTNDDPEVVACMEAIKEMSGGSPSKKAQDLCKAKKLTEAIEEAMKPK